MAWLCYGDITAGEWHKDDGAGMALSLPRLWTVPPVAGSAWGFVGLLEAVENPNSLFWEGWIKGDLW